MEQPKKTLFMADLLNCKIVTAEGKVIGHVADVQLTPAPEYKVIGLLYGWRGWLYRLHVFNPFSIIRGTQPPKPDCIPWDAVESFQHPVVKLKAGYEVKHAKDAQH